eukprot:751109-Hanusia_phi.AAC.2
MSSQEAVEFVWKKWGESDHGAEELVREAYRLGSYDNICAMVIDLRHEAVAAAMVEEDGKERSDEWA